MNKSKIIEKLEFDDISVRELFFLFFSNEQFFFKEKKITYRNFTEFYMTEILEDRNIDISEITPAPP
jgi:hypothetical protein